MRTLPLPEVTTHRDVPVTEVPEADAFAPSAELGVSKYSARLPREVQLDALLVNKGSDVLVVALHGATTRDKELPRFEFFRTLRRTEFSSMYFTDPALYLDDEVELAWYTGWLDFDLNLVMAQWAQTAASAIGASKILFLGSSGGGFGSLQVSAHIPGSMAMPFSPQTSIANYLVAGSGLGAQRSYIRAIMPHLTPVGGLDALRTEEDYFESLGERASPLLRYQQPQENYVYYVQNTNDPTHFNQHYLPFREAVENGPNKDRIRFELQDDRPGHNPPVPTMFLAALENAVAWLRQTT